MKKSDVVQLIFKGLPYTPSLWEPKREKGLAFAPTNIALCKYWGKRDAELNLPMTSSLSVSLPDKGALTDFILSDKPHDTVILNGNELSPDSRFVKRTTQFLDLFRPEKKWHLQVNIKMNIPVAAGLASSACGFAALILALRDMFEWNLTNRELSILARLGSGSAARSLWLGFVEWHAGFDPHGMDCFAEPMNIEWPALHIGILALSTKEKVISSRDAMQRTVDTSILYGNWPKKVFRDMITLRQALNTQQFSLLGTTAESNALAMHATMLSSCPPICYFMPETIAAMQKIWTLRQAGLEIYFTEDAGPNLKILFLDKDKKKVLEHFPDLDVIRLFDS